MARNQSSALHETSTFHDSNNLLRPQSILIPSTSIHQHQRSLHLNVDQRDWLDSAPASSSSAFSLADQKVSCSSSALSPCHTPHSSPPTPSSTSSTPSPSSSPSPSPGKNGIPLFRHQVAGHFPLLYNSGTICKPLNAHEFHFYRNLEREVPALVPFVPRFLGVMDRHGKTHRRGSCSDLRLLDQKHGVLTPRVSSDDISAFSPSPSPVPSSSFASSPTPSLSCIPPIPSLSSSSSCSSSSLSASASSSSLQSLTDSEEQQHDFANDPTLSHRPHPSSSSSSTPGHASSASSHPPLHQRPHTRSSSFSLSASSTPSHSHSAPSSSLSSSSSLASEQEQSQNDEVLAVSGPLARDPEFMFNRWAWKCQARKEGKLRKTKPHYIVLEDLTSAFSCPSILDLKIGTRQHGDDDSAAKVRSKMQKCASTTSASLGLRVCGMQVYRPRENRYIFHDKYFGRSLDKQSFIDTLYRFFHNGEELLVATIEAFIERLLQFKTTFSQETRYRFYSSSLLLVYESMPAVDLPPSSSTSSASSSSSSLSSSSSSSCNQSPMPSSPMRKGSKLMDVRMIDFAHTAKLQPTSNSTPSDASSSRPPSPTSSLRTEADTGLLFGLNCLIASLRLILAAHFCRPIHRELNADLCLVPPPPTPLPPHVVASAPDSSSTSASPASSASASSMSKELEQRSHQQQTQPQISHISHPPMTHSPAQEGNQPPILTPSSLSSSSSSSSSVLELSEEDSHLFDQLLSASAPVHIPIPSSLLPIYLASMKERIKQQQQ